MSDITIRPAAAADLETLARFNAAMARETEHLELDAGRLRAGVAALLADPARGFYLVAELAGAVVAQLMITYEWSDWRNGVFWWIQSVYVDPAFRRRGVFRALYREVERRAAAAGGVCGIRLYVERDNARARATYEGLGMRSTAYDMYEVDFVLRR